jgi:O-antigen/teichoic acid export membrane protein
LIQLRLGQWQVRKNPKSFGIFQVLVSLLNMALSLILVVVFTLGVTGRLTGHTTSVILSGIAALFLLRRDGLLTLVWRPDLMKEAVKFGVPLIPHIIGAFLLITVDRAVISSQLGLDAAGYYMVAVQLAMVLGLILESVNKAYTPWLYEKLKRNIREEKESIIKFTYAYGVFLLFCAAVAFLIGGDLLVFIAGKKYEPAADLIGWLVLSKAFHGMYYMVCSYIFYKKKTGLVAKITIATGILNIGLLFLFTNNFGLVGATWAMCISMFIQWILTWLTASKIVDMPWALRLFK